LANRLKVALEPRKSPVQARSAASVEAILEATIQVLLQVGKEKLTTTLVAARAGVSVGTLYQYFPNKSALLQAVLKQHLDEVTRAVEQVCKERSTRRSEDTPRAMATAVIHKFLDAKLKNAKTSAALYSVSSDVDGARISQQMGLRSHRAMTRMFASANESLTRDAHVVATMLQGLIVGVSRKVLESGAGAEGLDRLREEMVFMACAYLDACAARPPVAGTVILSRGANASAVMERPAS
jgi:AcrR family transcriptional regulator